MKAVVQRVKNASVIADGTPSGCIGKGLFILLGVLAEDTPAHAACLAKKCAKLRIFSDDADKMNLSLQDIDGQALVVSNFTLGADCRKGNRPSFTAAAPPEDALVLYEAFLRCLRDEGVQVENGVFGAHMDINTLCDGPVTILLDTDELSVPGIA